MHFYAKIRIYLCCHYLYSIKYICYEQKAFAYYITSMLINVIHIDLTLIKKDQKPCKQSLKFNMVLFFNSVVNFP